MVPNVLLKECFEKLGHGEFDPRWADLKKKEIDPILDYLEDLPVEQLNEIEGVLRNVFDLGCPSGYDALVEAAAHCGVGNLSFVVPDVLCVYGRAMWAWLHYRQVFEKALVIHQVVQLSWWRKRNDLPSNEPDMSPEAREKLERDISTLLKLQGRGKDCTVETMSRGDVDYFFAYPDDFVQNVMVHDENSRLTVEAFRQTLLIVFAYNREDGSLETFAKLPKPLKERLEAIFAKAILHWELGAHEPDAAYELNQLKDAWFELKTDPADRLHVRIRKMRLSAKYSGRRVLVEIDDADSDDDIHKAIRECINLEEVPLSEWNATQVTFCFEFLPLDGRKTGKHTFDVTYPRSCSLRNARPERVELIQKYMKQWEIDRAVQSRLVEVGS
jgi:hypothetical protein